MTAADAAREYVDNGFSLTAKGPVSYWVLGAIQGAFAAGAAWEREACLGECLEKAILLRLDRDAFARENDKYGADDMEACATVADDIAAAIRERAEGRGEG